MQSGRGWTKRGREGKKGRRGKEKRRKGRAEGECIGTENRVGREWERRGKSGEGEKWGGKREGGRKKGEKRKKNNGTLVGDLQHQIGDKMRRTVHF